MKRNRAKTLANKQYIIMYIYIVYTDTTISSLLTYRPRYEIFDYFRAVITHLLSVTPQTTYSPFQKFKSGKIHILLK